MQATTSYGVLAVPAWWYAANVDGMHCVAPREQLRGWLALISKQADVYRQIEIYAALGERLEFLSSFEILPWERPSADLFKTFRSDGIRIGTMDLKIARIAISQDATLLTRNLVDFSKVAGLHCENWLD